MTDRPDSPFAPAGLGLAAGLLCLAMLPGSAGADVFKWVDENGQTHFSANPPTGKKSDRLDVRAPGQAGSTPASTWQEQVQLSNQRRFQQQKSNQEAAGKASAAQQQCQDGQRSLEILNRERPISRTNAQGEREYLEDSQRAAAAEAARQRIAAYCK